MELTHTHKHKTSLKDFSKGQKIVAALYLITSHLSDTDPLKNALRTNGVLLASTSGNVRTQTGEHILSLLGIALLAKLISEKNASFLMGEIHYFLGNIGENENIVSLFEEHIHQQSHSIKRTSTSSNLSFMKPDMSVNLKKTYEIQDNKYKRQNDILSFINEKKAVAIKDISALFPDVSEKTIQRELGILVAQNKITKRGSKRWSVYMAVSGEKL